MNKTTKKTGKRLSAENIATGKRLLKYIMDLSLIHISWSV